MRKHQSLIPTDKALAVTNSKQCRISKLPDVRLLHLPIFPLLNPFFQLIAEVDRYTEHAMEKLTSDIFKARERIHLILNKLSIGDVVNNSKYAILFTSKRNDISSRRKKNKLCFSADFTEDVYFMHEELAQELEAQYEVNKSMYEQIEVWNELFLEFQEFEVSSLLSFFGNF